MKSTVVIRRPRLAPHARYRWDALREQHHIVFPEGVLMLNESGAAIVRCCDGRPIEEIVAALEDQFQATPLAPDVHGFVERLFEKGLIFDAAGSAGAGRH